MNESQITTVIDEICEKLGVGISNLQELVPRLASYRIAINTFWAITIGVIMLALVALTIFCFVRGSSEDCYADEELYFFVAIIAIIFGLCVAIVLALTIENLIAWNVAPDMKAIEYVCSLIN